MKQHLRVGRTAHVQLLPGNLYDEGIGQEDTRREARRMYDEQNGTKIGLQIRLNKISPSPSGDGHAVVPSFFSESYLGHSTLAKWIQSIRRPPSSISHPSLHPDLIHPGVHWRALRCTAVHSTSSPTPREIWKPQQRRPPAVRRLYCYESEGHWFKSSRARQKVRAPRAVGSRGFCFM